MVVNLTHKRQKMYGGAEDAVKAEDEQAKMAIIHVGFLSLVSLASTCCLLLGLLAESIES